MKVPLLSGRVWLGVLAAAVVGGLALVWAMDRAPRLTVRSDPPGATVRIDLGEAVGTTPLTDHPLESGLKMLTVEAEGYATWDTVLVARSGGHVLDVVLRPAGRARLSVSAEPESAAVWLDYAHALGTAPLAEVPLEAGLRVVTVEAPGYASRDTVLEVASAHHVLHVELSPRAPVEPQEAPLVAEEPAAPPPAASEVAVQQDRPEQVPPPQPAASTPTSPPAAPPDGEGAAAETGMLLLTSDPPDAVVLIDGERRGRTPLFLEGVPVGRRRVTIRHDDHPPSSRTVEVMPERTARQLFVDLGAGEARARTEEAPRSTYRPPRLAAGQRAFLESAAYPEGAREAGVEGTVVVSFVVEVDGTVSRARVHRGLTPDLDAEALRLVRGARFVPAEDDGQPVRAMYATSIRFTIGRDSLRRAP